MFLLLFCIQIRNHFLRLITGFVTRLTRRVPLVEQELLTLPEHLSLPPVFSAVRVTRSLVFVHSVLLQYTDSDCPFGIFKLFFQVSTLSIKIFTMHVTS